MIILRATDSRRARNSASLRIGGRRLPASRPSRRRCRLASIRVEPSIPVTSWLDRSRRDSRTRTTTSLGSSGEAAASSPRRRRRRLRLRWPSRSAGSSVAPGSSPAGSSAAGTASARASATCSTLSPDGNSRLSGTSASSSSDSSPPRRRRRPPRRRRRRRLGSSPSALACSSASSSEPSSTRASESSGASCSSPRGTTSWSMVTCSCCPSTSIESPDAPSSAAGDACTSTGAGSAASVTALSPDPSAGSSLGDVSARSLTAGDASSGTAAAAFFADRLRGARCRRFVNLLSRFRRLPGGLLGCRLLRWRTGTDLLRGGRGRLWVSRGRQVRRVCWRTFSTMEGRGRHVLRRTLVTRSHGLDGRSSLGTSWRPSRPYGCTSPSDRRRRIGRTCCIGCEMGIRVGLVIEHPDSSAARVTAPCSFAAPAQLGCGSLRRRCEAASAPAVRLPVSAGARRGGASAHFEQRPVTSLHSIEVEHPRHSNHGQYPTRPSRLRASALWRARGGFVDLACVRVEPPLPEPSEEWYFGGSEVGREPA